MPLNGVITDILKLIVGRPRPDFAFRCWSVGCWSSQQKCQISASGPEVCRLPSSSAPMISTAPETLTRSWRVASHSPVVTPPSPSLPGALSSSTSQVFPSTGVFNVKINAMKGKLGTFHCSRPISSWRLLLPLTFLLIPLSIALSRTSDYHHHWQDVLAGSLLGFSIIWMIYRQVGPN